MSAKESENVGWKSGRKLETDWPNIRIQHPLQTFQYLFSDTSGIQEFGMVSMDQYDEPFEVQCDMADTWQFGSFDIHICSQLFVDWIMYLF